MFILCCLLFHFAASVRSSRRSFIWQRYCHRYYYGYGSGVRRYSNLTLNYY